MSRSVLAADPLVLKHDPGHDHPEQPARYRAVMDGLRYAKLQDHLTSLRVQPAEDDLLTLVHTPEYVELVHRQVESGCGHLSTGDTAINGYSEQAARMAAGCAAAATDAVCSGRANNAFCVTRPPGHHASADVGMGFCVFNNIAIAARRAQSKWGVERVLIVDWDVHHGNGTQDIFYRDGSVLFFSSHQSPWYPGTGDRTERGEGAGEGLTINSPLPAGAGRDLVFQAFQEALFPAAETFKPELVLISAGFDSRFGDPLGQFHLSDDDFHELTLRLMHFADRFCGGRIVSILEGGYNLGGLASAAASHVSALLSVQLY